MTRYGRPFSNWRLKKLALAREGESRAVGAVWPVETASRRRRQLAEEGTSGTRWSADRHLEQLPIDEPETLL